MGTKGNTGDAAVVRDDTDSGRNPPVPDSQIKAGDQKELLDKKEQDKGFTKAGELSPEQRAKYNIPQAEERPGAERAPTREEILGQAEKNFQKKEEERAAEIRKRVEEDRERQKSGRPPMTSDQIIWGSGNPSDIEGSHKHHRETLAKLSDDDLGNIGKIAGELGKDDPNFGKIQDIIKNAFDGKGFDDKKLSNFLDGLRLQMQRLGKDLDVGASTNDSSAWVYLGVGKDGAPVGGFKLEKK